MIFKIIWYIYTLPYLIKQLNLDIFKGIGGLISILAMPVTTICVALFITKKMNDSSQEKNAKLSNLTRIDESSGWRKQVLEIASTYVVDMNTVCKLRACLGPERDDEQIKNEKDDTKIALLYFRKYIVQYCDSCIKNDECGNPEIIRIMGRFLLKAHWEYYVNEIHMSSDDKNKYEQNIEASIKRFSIDLSNNGFFIDEKNHSFYVE